MSRSSRLGCWLAFGISIGVVGGPVRAAKLRSTIDDVTVVRTVSAEQATELAPEPEPMAEFLPAADDAWEPSCGACCEADACCLSDQTWVGLDYLVWWRNGRFFPPLVTTNPNAGVLPGATVLFGGDNVKESPRPGGRLEVGHWFDPGHCLGLGGHLVAMSDAPVSMSLSSDQLGFFARPFFDAANNNNPTAQAIGNNAANPATRGHLDLQAGSELLASDFFVRLLLVETCAVRLDLLAGYQFARISEDLTINTLTETLPGGRPSLAVRDTFSVTNEYNAGHFGFLGTYQRGRWGLEFLARFGFGTMRETVSISGATATVDANGGTSNRASGLLAQSTNIGQYSQDVFAFMEDTGIKLVYCPRERLKLSLGYSLMYWSNVQRPGDAIDLSIDSRLLANPVVPGANATQPAFAFDTTHYLVHGLNFGLEFRF